MSRALKFRLMALIVALGAYSSLGDAASAQPAGQMGCGSWSCIYVPPLEDPCTEVASYCRSECGSSSWACGDNGSCGGGYSFICL